MGLICVQLATACVSCHRRNPSLRTTSTCMHYEVCNLFSYVAGKDVCFVAAAGQSDTLGGSTDKQLPLPGNTTTDLHHAKISVSVRKCRT